MWRLTWEKAYSCPERVFNFHGLPLLDVRPHPVDTMSYTLGKRIFDVAFSAATLAVAAPVMAVIAALIKLTSPGPIFFSQERLSLNGKRFKMLKFELCACRSRGPAIRSTPHATIRVLLPSGAFFEKPAWMSCRNF